MANKKSAEYWIGAAEKEVHDHRKGNGHAPSGSFEKIAYLIAIIASLLMIIRNNDAKYKHEIARLHKALAETKAVCKENQIIITKQAKRLKIVDGSDTPPSKKIIREPKSGGNDANPDSAAAPSGKEKKKNRPGTTDNRRADSTNHARFVPCQCGCNRFRVTKTRTTNLDSVPKVSYTTIQYREMWGVCVDCGAKAQASLYEERAIPRDNTMQDGEQNEPPSTTAETVCKTLTHNVECAAAAEPQAEGPADDSETHVVTTPSGIRMEQDGESTQNVSDSDIRKGSIVHAEEPEGRTSKKIPKKGRMDYSVLSFILSTWFYRATLEGVSGLLNGRYYLNYSRVTIMAALMRAAEAFKPFSDDVLKRLMASANVYIDETSLWVKNKRMYVWLITNGKESYYFVHTRAPDMLLELFGEYQGTVSCDGYVTRFLFKSIQRCWAHVIRKYRWFANYEKTYTPQCDTARRFKACMDNIFRFAVDEKLAGRGKESRAKAHRMLRGALSYYGKFEEIAEVVKYVKNAEKDLFTFMEYESVEATNNIAERGMREIVKQRVVRVIFRTMKGASAFATLMTVLMTAKARGISVDDLVETYM